MQLFFSRRLMPGGDVLSPRFAMVLARLVELCGLVYFLWFTLLFTHAVPILLLPCGLWHFERH